MIDLIAVRHGETDWNVVRRLQGHTDIALNEAGIEQAVRLALALANERIEAIHSSDLARALATARPVAAGLRIPVIENAALRERNYGVLEGRTFPEILAQDPDHAERLRLRDATWTIPGGESQETFHRRVIATVSSIAADAEARAYRSAGGPKQTILIVTHGGVLDMLYRSAFGIALDAERTFATPNAVINRLTFDDGRFTVTSWAEEA